VAVGSQSDGDFVHDAASEVLGGHFLTPFNQCAQREFDSNFLQNIAKRVTRHQDSPCRRYSGTALMLKREDSSRSRRDSSHIRSAIDRDTGTDSTCESSCARVARPMRRAEAYARMLTWISDSFVLAGESSHEISVISGRHACRAVSRGAQSLLGQIDARRGTWSARPSLVGERNGQPRPQSLGGEGLLDLAVELAFDHHVD
jgi:hypothetical protein